jgi:hypothetical protein
MRNALRPYMTAGVAVVGASALAVAPVIATPPDVKIVNPAAVQTASPLDTYVDTVKEALENLEALLGSALALPAPTGWTLELALDSLFSDPSGNVDLFVDDLEALGPLAGSSLPALLDNAVDAVETAIDQAVEGNVDLAVVSLIRMYVTLAPAVVAVVGAPLGLLGPEAAAVANVVLAKSLNAAVGPVLSGVGKTGVAIQNIVNALNSAEPGSGALLCALIAAPGTVADGVLNGYALVPSTIAFPGLLTPGDAFDPTKPNPGPVALALGFARGLGAVPTPPPAAAVTNFSAPENARVVTIEVTSSPPPFVPDQKPLADDAKEIGDLGAGPDVDLDEGTNQKVMTGVGGSGKPETAMPHPSVFGGSSGTISGGGAGLGTLRQGIRDGVREFRDGLRDAVKTVTGRGNERAGAGEAADDESSG